MKKSENAKNEKAKTNCRYPAFVILDTAQPESRIPNLSGFFFPISYFTFPVFFSTAAWLRAMEGVDSTCKPASRASCKVFSQAEEFT
jgi:hypothetical protein